MDNPKNIPCLERTLKHVLSISLNRPHDLLPSQAVLHAIQNQLLSSLPEQGCGIDNATTHLLDTIVPGLNHSSLSPNYYGFVTGGSTPAARVADAIVTAYDQNVQVHLPDQAIITVVEDRALRLVLDLLQLEHATWKGRTFTTGATASNVLGILCGREHVVGKALEQRTHMSGNETVTVAHHGLFAACRVAELDKIQVLTTQPHSSLFKACSIAGLGRSSVIDVGFGGNDIGFDFSKLEDYLKRKHSASIVVVSCGDVNTGLFATNNVEDMRKLRSLCDIHGAWLHVDGAFGLFARTLDNIPEFESVRGGTEGLELADSVTGDAHKLLNVPYDCGFFFCQDPDIAQQVCQNPNAAYLNSASSSSDGIASPLNVGIENSRRFRSLPVYATLMAYGREGYRDMVTRQVRLARSVASFLLSHPAFELLPKATSRPSSSSIFIVVLFRAKNDALNRELVQRINASSRMYVSGTVWQGQPASRIAIANWQVDVERDIANIKAVLQNIACGWGCAKS